MKQKWFALTLCIMLVMEHLLLIKAQTGIQIIGNYTNVYKYGNIMFRNRTITFRCSNENPYQLLQVPGGTVEILCQGPQLTFVKTLVATIPRRIRPVVSQLYLTSDPNVAVESITNQTVTAPPLLRKLLQVNSQTGGSVAGGFVDTEPQTRADSALFGFAVGFAACITGTCGGISDADITALSNQITALQKWQTVITSWASQVTLYQQQSTAQLFVIQNTTDSLNQNLDNLNSSQAQISDAIRIMTSSNVDLFNNAHIELAGISNEIQNTAIQFENLTQYVATELLNQSSYQMGLLTVQINNSVATTADNFLLIENDIRSVDRLLRQSLQLHHDWFNSIYFIREQTSNVWKLLTQLISDGFVPVLEPDGMGQPPLDSIPLSLLSPSVDVSYLNFIYNVSNIPTIASHRISFTCDSLWAIDNLIEVNGWRDILDWIGTSSCNPLGIAGQRDCQCWITDDFEECQLSPTSSISSWQDQRANQQFVLNETNNCVVNTRNAESINYYSVSDWHHALQNLCNLGTYNNTHIRIFDQGLSQLIDILPPNLIGIPNVCGLDATSALDFPSSQPTVIYSLYKFWELSLETFQARLPAINRAIYGVLPAGLYQERQDYTRTVSGIDATIDFLEFIGHDNVTLPVYDVHLSEIVPSVSVQRVTNNIIDGSAQIYTPDNIQIPALEMIPSPFRYVSNDLYWNDNGLLYDVPMESLPLTFNARQASFTPMAFARPVNTEDNITSNNLPPPLTLPEWKSLYGPFWEPLRAAVSASIFGRSTTGTICEGTLKCTQPKTVWNEMCQLHENFQFFCSTNAGEDTILTLVPLIWAYDATINLPEGPLSVVIEGNCPELSNQWYEDGTLDIIATNPSPDSDLSFMLGWNAGCETHVTQIVPQLFTLRTAETRNIPIKPVCSDVVNVSAFGADNVTGQFTKSCYTSSINNNTNSINGTVTYSRNTTGLIVNGILPTRFDVETLSQTSVDPVIQGLKSLISSILNLSLQLSTLRSPSLLSNLLIDGSQYTTMYNQLTKDFVSLLNETFSNIVGASNLTRSAADKAALDLLFEELANSSAAEHAGLNKTNSLLTQLNVSIANNIALAASIKNLTAFVIAASANLTKANNALLAQIAVWSVGFDINLPNLLKDCGASISCWIKKLLMLLVSIIAVILGVVLLFYTVKFAVSLCAEGIEGAGAGDGEELALLNENVKHTDLVSRTNLKKLRAGGGTQTGKLTLDSGSEESS